MMIAVSRPTLLVVAPQPDLRRSLVFVLEAEGYHVKTSEVWPPETDQGHIDGLVIDEGGLHQSVDLETLSEQFGNRIVILVSQLGRAVNIQSATIVRKPLLESTLIDCVQAVLPKVELGGTTKPT